MRPPRERRRWAASPATRPCAWFGACGDSTSPASISWRSRRSSTLPPRSPRSSPPTCSSSSCACWPSRAAEPPECRGAASGSWLAEADRSPRHRATTIARTPRAVRACYAHGRSQKPALRHHHVRLLRHADRLGDQHRGCLSRCDGGRRLRKQTTADPRHDPKVRESPRALWLGAGVGEAPRQFETLVTPCQRQGVPAPKISDDGERALSLLLLTR